VVLVVPRRVCLLPLAVAAAAVSTSVPGADVAVAPPGLREARGTQVQFTHPSFPPSVPAKIFAFAAVGVLSAPQVFVGMCERTGEPFDRLSSSYAHTCTMLCSYLF
jgi:hypothetical protein